MTNKNELLTRLNVSHETIAKLRIYLETLSKWQKKINLVSNSSLADGWNRHMLDSAQLALEIPKDASIVDIGTGAGFPGMVLAIMGYNVFMIESDGKKIAFLKEIARLTHTKTTLIHERVEEVRGLKADIVTSRACSNLTQLFYYSCNFVSHETICLFPKGKNYSTEVEEASRAWKFDYKIIPNLTDPEGVIIKISGVQPYDENLSSSEPKGRRG